MATQKLLLLPGDGIGPEVMAEGLKVLETAARKFSIRLEFDHKLVGGAAIDAAGSALPAETLAACEKADAILFGSVGGPKWESLPAAEQPERAALLPLRKHFGLFANLRPAICLPELTHASPLNPKTVEGGFNVLCVRELTGGLYFGEPKYLKHENGEDFAVDTMVYWETEIRRIAKVAFEAAKTSDRIILQHLLLGMNAHINLDLAVSAAGMAPGAAIAGLEHDFSAINDILNRQIDKVQDAIARVSPAMWVLDKVGGRDEERLVAFSLKKAREEAWRNAQRLAATPPDGLVDAIGDLDRATAGLGDTVANPPGMFLRMGLWWIVRQENPSVAAIIDALASA